jgi:predicted Zn finger-like uncharacterized protein
VVVICPKCKIRLKVDDGKLTEKGSRFKCPKCSTVLLVKKPQPVVEKPVDALKILVAHSNHTIMNEITALLRKNGYQIITATDGIDAMVKSIKELPFLAVLEVSLPKIYGFEVCKRLKGRIETKAMKSILVSSPYDKERYKRDPESLYEADDYMEEHRISDLLIDSINSLLHKEPKKPETIPQQPVETPTTQKPEMKTEPPIQSEVKPVPTPAAGETIERAQRLARTILSDIYLYNTAKAEEAIKNETFSSVFAAELREGLKLYETRISAQVRAQGDFFKDVMRDFIENKKKAL